MGILGCVNSRVKVDTIVYFRMVLIAKEM